VDQPDLAVSQQFQMSSQLAFGTPYSLGYSLNLSVITGIQGEYPVGLAKLGLLDDHRFGLVISRFRHMYKFRLK
jgi:hypothetical protein